MEHENETCGQELASSAAVPEQFAALFKHVAVNFRDHAAWVGTATAEAEREHDAMLAVALGYEATAESAQRTAVFMRTLAGLPAAAHDPHKMDRAKFFTWMKTKLELQRALAGMLIEHAEQSERALQAIRDET
jgi:hypothetical protein